MHRVTHLCMSAGSAPISSAEPFPTARAFPGGGEKLRQTKNSRLGSHVRYKLEDSGAQGTLLYSTCVSHSVYTAIYTHASSQCLYPTHCCERRPALRRLISGPSDCCWYRQAGENSKAHTVDMLFTVTNACPTSVPPYCPTSAFTCPLWATFKKQSSPKLGHKTSVCFSLSI